MDVWGWVLKSRILAGRGWQLQHSFRSVCLASISFPRRLRACPVFHWPARRIPTPLCGSSFGQGELNDRREMGQPLLFFTEKAGSVTGVRHTHNMTFVVCTRWQTRAQHLATRLELAQLCCGTHPALPRWLQIPQSFSFGKGNDEPNSLLFFWKLYKMQIIMLKRVSRAQGGFPYLC